EHGAPEPDVLAPAAVQRDPQRRRVEEAGLALDVADAAAAGELAEAAHEPGDDPLLPPAQPGQVHLGLAELDAEPGSGPGLGQEVRGVEQGLRWNAALVQAHPARVR